MTSSSSLKRPFAVRERSSERNLLTACDLDSPICFADGFLGNRTTNLPSLEREWFDSKCRTTVRSSVESIEWSAGVSSELSEDVVPRGDSAVESGDTGMRRRR